MITSIELQVISKLLTSDSEDEIKELIQFDSSYYSIFKPHIQFILNHFYKYNDTPDVFTFQSEFPDVTLVTVSEPLTYLCQEMRKNKQHIILIETFNKLKDLGSGDVSDAWKYLSAQCDRVNQLDSTAPLDIVKEAKKRSDEVAEYSKKARIPTGFPEIDKLMYGGLSTVEELLLILARTNTGKSWVCTKMMESAQKNGFPVLYYSPEMKASFIGTRFDTWRAHFQNSKLFQGKYDDNYLDYLKALAMQETSAYVLEDSDMPDDEVNVPNIQNMVERYKIKLLIIDGLSYMSDSRKSDTDYVKYKNLCTDLFKLSKKYGCAVVIAMQANRATQETKDDKGQPFPSLYNLEGSDHPGRIATQAFSLRQVFDKHVLDIRLEKSRMANNQKPVCSYAWDVNTGNMQYLPGGDDDDPMNNSITPPTVSLPQVTSHISSDIDLDDIDDDDVEF
jgi:replicative DNA helicase